MTTLRLVILLIILGIINSWGQETNNLLGTYYSVNNKFEKSSIMTLGPNNTFKYSYAVGGCQGEVTGTWTIKNKKIRFENDKEFKTDDTAEEKIIINDTLTNIGTPYNPDLSKTDWRFNSKTITPITFVDIGCFKENGRHRRK